MTNMHQLRNFPGVMFGVTALLSMACGNDPAGPAGSAGSPGSSGSAGSATAGGGAGMAGSAGANASGGGGSGMSGSGGAASGAGSAGMGSGGSAGGPPSTDPFSFFVTSMATMYDVAKAFDTNLNEGFGGDLTYGEQGPGAGLRGADKICAAVAEKGMPSNNKTWRAFLSATAGEDGMPVNAIDRIGEGPWYDRTARIVAMTKAALQNSRPMGADEAIIDDLPNEFGLPNSQPDLDQDPVDNHDTLTGSNEAGELDTEDMGDTCNDWTSRVGETGVPRIGHSWPRMGGGGGGEPQSWISEHDTGGCAPGANIFGEGGPPPGDLRVGAGGGYGGIYCFALEP